MRRSPLPSLSAGFTLLEVLVVIIIAGIIATSAVIAVGVLGRDRDMQDQAERLWAILQQAKEESELQGFDLGLRIGLHGYDFLRFDARQQRWVAVAQDDLLMPRELPPGLRMRLWLEGREAILTERPGATTDTIANASPKRTVEETEDGAGDSARSVTAADGAQELPPQVMLLSSGDLNSFEVHFEREASDARWRVYSKVDGTVAVEELREQL